MKLDREDAFDLMIISLALYVWSKSAGAVALLILVCWFAARGMTIHYTRQDD